MKEKLIQEIVEREWEMFSHVQNEGGKADCQKKPRTFEIMRSSQFQCWTETVLELYLRDLKQADILGRNLCTEKYAFMMEVTAPGEYEKIKKCLPEISKEVMGQIKAIADTNMEWEEYVNRIYPALRSNGRPLYKEQDSPLGVSVETYFICELKTYSPETIRALYEYTMECRRKNRNLALETLEYTVKAYGYESLEQAEEELELQREVS